MSVRELKHGRGCVPMIDSHELSEWGIYFKVEAAERVNNKGSQDFATNRPHVMGGE